MTEFRIVFVTHPELSAARQLARQIVEESLCACVNLVPAIQSIFIWKGILEESSEVMMIIKTHISKLHDLEKRIRELHPYEVFEFVAMPITSGHEPYLSWIAEILQKDGKNL